MIVDVHIPLVMDQYSPETVQNMIRVLDQLGIAVNYPVEQTTSGYEHFQNGYWDDAKKAGEKFIREFNNDRPVIIPSATISGFIKNDCAKLFNNTAFHNEFKQLQNNVFELSDFIASQDELSVLKLAKNGIVGVFDGCGNRKYPTAENVRKILSGIEGITVANLPEGESCCGYGGGFIYRNPEVSQQMAAGILKNAPAVDYVVSTEMSCVKQMQIVNEEYSEKIFHLIDFIAASITD